MRKLKALERLSRNFAETRQPSLYYPEKQAVYRFILVGVPQKRFGPKEKLIKQIFGVCLVSIIGEHQRD